MPSFGPSPAFGAWNPLPQKQNTTCIQESSNFSRGWQSCAVAGDLPHEVPRVFSGDTMNLTVSLGTTQQRLHPTMRNQDAVIGIVQLQQPPDGSLFVIGDIRAKMQMGLAMFSNMALQPVTPPISNREYEFRCGLLLPTSQHCSSVCVEALVALFRGLRSVRMPCSRSCAQGNPQKRTGTLLF